MEKKERRCKKKLVNSVTEASNNIHDAERNEGVENVIQYKDVISVYESIL